jgi:hypothetical protein
MSTSTPVIPAATTAAPATSALVQARPTTATGVAATPTKAAAASAIVATHHPIIKLVIIGVIAWALAGRVERAWANHEQKVFDSKNATLQAQVTANAQTAQQNAALASQNAVLLEKYQDLVTQLSSQKAQVQTATKTQQTADAALSPDALSARWAGLIKDQNAVHPITGGYQVSQAGAVETMQALETIAELNTEYAADEQQLAAQGGLVTGIDNQITGLQSQVTGLQKQNVDEVTTCNAQIAQVKSEEAVKIHKARKQGFIAGVIIGFIGGLFGAHSAGI